MIELRSDTLTLPTEAMLEAQRHATGGDDSRDGDPTVRLLEERAARMLGKEAGLFVVSGTMGNLVALLAHAHRGGEVLVDAGAHLLRSELGGVSMLGGLFPRTVPAVRGAMDLDALRAAIVPGFLAAKIPTGLIWMETSHNDAGGAVPPLQHMLAVGEIARAAGVPSHIDGARFFNAVAALGTTPAALAAAADSVSFCISKGLSAPIGAVLVGPAAFILRARAYRRMVGGALRQAGGLASAGLIALETMIDRLPEDHRTARRLAAGIAAIDPALTSVAGVDTNIVRIDTTVTGLPAAEWVGRLNSQGVRVGAWDTWQIRCVTHRHIDDQAVDRAVAAFRAMWPGARAA
jgi:threonine aldolase